MMKKIRVAVFGASGRMGKEVSAIINKDKTLELVNLAKGKPQVVIDFSSPEGLLKVSEWCSKNKVCLVSGTTGLRPNEEKILRLRTKKLPFLYSPNFSLGLNAMARATEIFLKSATPGEIAIEEIHHKNKKDNPSGTAKFLFNVVKRGASNKTMVGEPVGLRGGEVFGVHKVLFFFEGEWVAFEHQVQNRTIFAQGAVEVSKWLVGQRPGAYNMNDYFKGNEK